MHGELRITGVQSPLSLSESSRKERSLDLLKQFSHNLLDSAKDALARTDREHEHSVLHTQQLQAASDGAARVPSWSRHLIMYGATIVCVM